MKLITAIDFSPFTMATLATTERLLKATHGEAWLIHVAAPDPDFVGMDVGPESERNHIAKKLRDEHRKLEDLAADLTAKGLKANPLLISGPTSEKLVEQAQRLQADLIIMGTHGHRPLHDLLTGSVSNAVVRSSKCPVVMVPMTK